MIPEDPEPTLIPEDWEPARYLDGIAGPEGMQLVYQKTTDGWYLAQVNPPPKPKTGWWQRFKEGWGAGDVDIHGERAGS